MLAILIRLLMQPSNMQLINDNVDVRDKYVIVRSSTNVPLASGVVANEFRLRQALPTILWLQEQGAKVIMVGHIGREESDTLVPVYEALKKYLTITWGGKITSNKFKSIHEAMIPGQVVLVENIRSDVRESENDEAFASLLSSYADIYVNDAFDNIHRNHATMLALPKLLPSYAGLTLANEVSHISEAKTPQSPSLFILGGAKFETKMPLIEKYLDIYDFVFVGGALANDILLALGYEVGKSLISPVSLAGHALLQNKKLLKPVDVVVDRNGERLSVLISAVEADDMIVDMGERTVEMLKPYINQAKSILWNGPLGKYESTNEGSTEAVARLIANSTGTSVLGGGDTVAAVEDLELNDKFTFVSTGGGAMLELLEKGTTPVLEAIGYTGK